MPSPMADPWRVALREGWHAGKPVRLEWGKEVFWQVWDGSEKDGPLLNF